MSALNDALGEFAHAIVNGGELAACSHGSGMNYSLATALGVYRNNYRGNLHDALAGAYPVLEQLVGKDFFRMMTRQYIGLHASRSANLHHYGAAMAEFIAAFEPARSLAYLPDVAALEWACHCAYFAEDAPSLDLAELAQISPQHYAELRLHLHPACHLLRSSYPVAAIWQAHQPGAASDFQLDMEGGASNALVSRQHDIVFVNALSDADSAWLHDIQAGLALGEATAATLERYPAFDLQTVLLNLAAQDVVSSFSLTGKS